MTMRKIPDGLLEQSWVHRLIYLVAQGKTSRQIGKEIGYSEDYIKTVLQWIFRSLDVHSRAELVYVAMKKGLIR
jgi:DNA-binding NarL/FixJ family response regulator